LRCCDYCRKAIIISIDESLSLKLKLKLEQQKGVTDVR